MTKDEVTEMLKKRFEQPIWHKYPEEKPKEAGKYLAVREGLMSYYYYIAIWGKSACLDSCDESLKALTSYWFEYDSEWGDCIITDILAWMPIPQYTKEKDNEHNENQ